MKLKVKPKKSAMKLIWKCPICADDEAIVRGSQEHLNMAMAAHILKHEQTAALRAVDRARVECVSPSCEIGRKNHWNKTIGSSELSLSEFDRNLLSAMKVGTE